MYLAIDVGGTKADFGLFNKKNERVCFLEELTLTSGAFPSLQALIEEYLRRSAYRDELGRLQGICCSLAGPIAGGACRLVSLGWLVDFTEVQASFPHLPTIRYCNDLEAVGYGLDLLPPEDLHALTPDLPSHPQGNRAILAPGTGLGECLILGGKVYPSEGAHADFGPRSEQEVRLWRFLHQRYDHVSYERLLSGPGLQNIYAFLLEESPTKAAAVDLSALLTPEEISRRALVGLCPLCVEALTLFFRILGAEAGNLALKGLPFGGVYLGGGILPSLLSFQGMGVLIEGFLAKGRFRTLVEQIPIYLILNKKTALYGAAYLALFSHQKAVLPFQEGF